MMKGKVAIITASTLGIGKECARRLAKQGCKVVLSSRKQQNVDEAVKEFRQSGYDAIGIVCHAGIAEDRAKLIELTLKEYGRIDYVVVNAGVSTFMGLLGVDKKSLDKLWQINVYSGFFLIKQTYPYLKKNPGSSVVFMSSVSGFNPQLWFGHYSLSKTAMNSLVKALAKEMEKDGIRVNAVSPGIIKTQFSSYYWKTGNPDLVKKYFNFHRIGEASEVADLVKYLLSDEASYVNGENIIIKGSPTNARL